MRLLQPPVNPDPPRWPLLPAPCAMAATICHSAAPEAAFSCTSPLHAPQQSSAVLLRRQSLFCPGLSAASS